MHKLLALTICLAALAVASPCRAAETRGAGSTFVSPVLAKWIAAYKEETGNIVGYQSVGSGNGVNLIKKAAVDFGTSDIPLEPQELTSLGMVQFPLVIGGVVPVVNVDGIAPGQMRFTGPLLADIFLGKIKNWGDPAIKAVNPDLKIPNIPIIVVHRIDVSGTTFNWSSYLSKVSAEWKASVGEGGSVEWPLGVGGRGNDGVASAVALIPGAIGYLEYAYALQKLDKISFCIVQNSVGNFVSPSVESFQAAASGADWKNATDFFLVMTDAPGVNAYPITATTFVLMYKQPKSKERSEVALDFFRWALEDGQTQADALHYVSLPPELVEQIEIYWQSHFSNVALSTAANGK